MMSKKLPDESPLQNRNGVVFFHKLFFITKYWGLGNMLDVVPHFVESLVLSPDFNFVVGSRFRPCFSRIRVVWSILLVLPWCISFFRSSYILSFSTKSKPKMNITKYGLITKSEPKAVSCKDTRCKTRLFFCIGITKNGNQFLCFIFVFIHIYFVCTIPNMSFKIFEIHRSTIPISIYPLSVNPFFLNQNPTKNHQIEPLQNRSKWVFVTQTQKFTNFRLFLHFFLIL